MELESTLQSQRLLPRGSQVEKAPDTMGDRPLFYPPEGIGMSQGDVLDWLQAHPGWHKPEKVAQGLEKNVAKTKLLLRRLWHRHDIERQEIDSQRCEYRYPEDA